MPSQGGQDSRRLEEQRRGEARSCGKTKSSEIGSEDFACSIGREEDVALVPVIVVVETIGIRVPLRVVPVEVHRNHFAPCAVCATADPSVNAKDRAVFYSGSRIR